MFKTKEEALAAMKKALEVIAKINPPLGAAVALVDICTKVVETNIKPKIKEALINFKPPIVKELPNIANKLESKFASFYVDSTLNESVEVDVNAPDGENQLSTALSAGKKGHYVINAETLKDYSGIFMLEASCTASITVHNVPVKTLSSLKMVVMLKFTPSDKGEIKNPIAKIKLKDVKFNTEEKVSLLVPKHRVIADCVFDDAKNQIVCNVYVVHSNTFKETSVISATEWDIPYLHKETINIPIQVKGIVNQAEDLDYLLKKLHYEVPFPEEKGEKLVEAKKVDKSITQEIKNWCDELAHGQYAEVRQALLEKRLIIRLMGHANDKGNSPFNQKLALERAKFVGAFLKSYADTRYPIQIKSAGELGSADKPNEKPNCSVEISII